MRVSGPEHSFGIAKDYWHRIVAVVDHRKYSKALVDKDFPQQLSIGASHMLISELGHSGCRMTKIAVVDRAVDEEACLFDEMVATNRG